jgi:DNA-binding XRE family transcriptional regulator
MYYTREYLNRAHREIDTIFRVLFPEHGMAVREEQIMLEKKMTQQKLGAMVGVSYRTIRAWEVDGRYPKQSSLYQKLADAFQCRVSYLMDDNETVCLGNDEPSEYSGAKQARQILEQTAALFASGTMTNEDKTIFMDEMTRLYLESKKNRRKW